LSYGLLAPAGTPQPIVQKLNKVLNDALVDDVVRKRIINEGAEPEPGTPADQAAVIDHEETKWRVIQSVHLQPK
jgi:tripartite-type tricarboxylate transporter receptor subunit TctC